MNTNVASSNVANTEAPVYQESRLRSLLKAFSWRIIATLTTATIAFAVTGELGAALLIGGIEFSVKLFIYYVHERVWQMVPRGTVRRLYSAGSDQ